MRTLSRRGFLRVTGAGAAALTASSVRAAGAQSRPFDSAQGRPFDSAQGRPNILFIMSDDHAARAMSCYGGRINRTPNLDRIAAEGMRLDNCFCTNSICTPSRATILTGKYSHKNGCRAFNAFDGSQQTFPRLLQQAGYHTGVVGKWHLHSEPVGFDVWRVLPGQGKYFDPELIEPGGRKTYKGYVTDIITDLALKFLAERPKDRPFCLLYHHKAPHDNFEYDRKHADLYKDADIPEPDNLLDDYANRGEAIKRVTQKIGMRHTAYARETGDLPPAERKRKCYQIYIKSYLRCVASIDDNVGRVLDWLKKEGLEEDTIVVYTSDQGFFLGEHGMYDKRFMYEESLRVPFVLRYPREVKPGSVSDAMVLNVDFAETLLDYAGVAVPRDMQGRSIRPILRGRRPADWRTSMYYRYWLHLPHFRVAAHFGVRTRDHKLIYYYGRALGTPGARPESTPPEWELFDLRKDPHEMRNVFADPACADVVRRLAAELKRLRRELEDEADGIDIDAALAGKPLPEDAPPERPAPAAKEPLLTDSAFGRRLETFGSGFGTRVRKLPKAYRRHVTFRLKMQSAQETGPRNGFLVFGRGETLQDLMKAGVYFGNRNYAIENGPAATQDGWTKQATFDAAKVFDVTVTVDLQARKVELAVDGETRVTAPLMDGITEVTHAGYCCWSRTKTDFSEIAADGK